MGTIIALSFICGFAVIIFWIAGFMEQKTDYFAVSLIPMALAGALWIGWDCAKDDSQAQKKQTNAPIQLVYPEQSVELNGPTI